MPATTPTAALHRATHTFDLVDRRIHTFAVRHSVSTLRVALAFVFILFGALKFFPGLSPAQAIATGVMTKLTFGLVPADTALLAVAVAEVGVGLCLLSNRFMRVAVWFLALEMFAILSPLVLFPGELFSGPHHLPSLLGQYILKDFVLLGGVLVLFATQHGAKIIDPAPEPVAVPDTKPARQARPSIAPSHATNQTTPARPSAPRRRGAVQAASSRSAADRSSSVSTVRL